jgi:hypothetical protein
MSFSNYFETQVLQWAFTTGSATRPTQWHIALYTAAPSDTGGGTEVSGNGYARVAATFTVSGNLATNASSLEWAAATGSWGTVTHAAVFDAATGGNMLAHGALTSARTINSGDTLRIPSGDLDITLD